MAKYYGMLGFADYTEETPGNLVETIVERPYYGEVTRNLRRVQWGSFGVNDGSSLSNAISVLLDPYAQENFYNLRYLTFMGAKWRVTSVEMKYPRLIVNLGGLYDVEEETGDSTDLF